MKWISPQFLKLNLQALDGTRFASFGNALLSSVAARAQLDRTHLDLTLNVTDRDGGVDARCRNAPRIVGRLIPASNVVYQFKGGRRKRSAAMIARQDIAEKPRVREALQRGETFVYVTAVDYGPETANNIVRALAKTHGMMIDREQLVVINGETLAHELQGLPSLVAEFLGLDVRLLAMHQWGQLQRLSNPFQKDEKLEIGLRSLRAQILSAHSMTRVVGAAGNGKTRFVLEALRESDVAADVLYARQPDDVTPAVWAHLRTTPDTQCALVVDEVDDGTAQDLKEQFGLTHSGVRLVMIGRDASGRAQADTVQVAGLNEELLVRAIGAVAPGLPQEAAREIAAVCERSPKLAVLLAERARDDPSLVEHYRRLADREIRNVLDTLLPLDAADIRALSALALVEHLGWIGDASEESTRLFEFVELDPLDARDRINRLDERFGIAPRAGRYRYVSPEILADHLAARHLDAWPAGKFRDMFDRLPPHLTASVTARLRRLTGVLANAQVVEEVILGNQGPFRTLADLEASRLATLLPDLAGPLRHASIGALRRIIDPASDEELRAATKSRRHLVNALEQLLWPEDTFEDAARLLLRLAANENETWANNATGLFAETFQTTLGRTAAGALPRSAVLRRAAGSNNPGEREVAAKAIQAAVRLGHVSRMGMPPRNVPGMPAREWRPSTYGELYDAIESYLDILTSLLQDRDAAVRKAAVKALADAVHIAGQVSRVADAWIATARLVTQADFDERATLLDALDWEFRRDEARERPTDVSDAAKAEWDARIARLRAFQGDLLGADFSSRFRHALSQMLWPGSRLRDNEQEVQKALEGMAHEVTENPHLLQLEWDWLNHRQANHPEFFFDLLGRIDRDRRINNVLSQVAEEKPRAVGWLSLYELGQAAAAEDPKHVDRLAAAWRGDAGKAAQVFDLLLRAGHSASRAAILIDLFEADAVPKTSIASLAYSTWRTNLDPAEAHALATAAATDPAATAPVITFLAQYLHDAQRSARTQLRDLVLRLISQPRPKEQRRQWDDDWDRLAKLYVHEEPLQIGAAVLQDVAAREHAHGRELKEVLQIAWNESDKRRFFTEVIAPWLDADSSEAWWVRLMLEHFPVAEAGLDLFISWVSEKPASRARALAAVISEPIGRPSDLHATLLERFEEHGVGDVFFGKFISGTWIGPHSSRSKGLLDDARKWLEDDRPAIRDWAKRTVANLEHMVKRDVLRDAEERLRRR